MNKKDIYNNYLIKIKDVLEKDDFAGIDYILEFMYTGGVPENELNSMYEILQEVTLYAEFKEIEYKETALILIKEFEENL